MSIKDVLGVRLARVRRCVATVHHATPIKSGRKRAMTRLAAWFTDSIVVGTNAMRDLLRGIGVPSSRIRIIPFGVRPPRNGPSRAKARANLGLDGDAFVISTLCRHEPHKGIDDLIEAVARVPDPHERIRLVVGGDGPMRSRWEDRARSLLGPRSVFLGHVPDTADLYAAADIFALPSYEEGFGLVYIEAAFFGVPSVGTTAGGMSGSGRLPERAPPPSSPTP
jgi:glycosyltransferase involved in cell wall biosynthesis